MLVKENLEDVLKPKSAAEIKDAINKIKKDYFTVGDLKKLLKDIPDDLPVGKSGHFGEFNPMDKYDFRVRTSNPVPIGKSWRNMIHIDMSILEINSPDLGELPD